MLLVTTIPSFFCHSRCLFTLNATPSGSAEHWLRSRLLVPSADPLSLLQYFRSRLADRINCSCSSLDGEHWIPPERIDCPTTTASFKTAVLEAVDQRFSTTDSVSRAMSSTLSPGLTPIGHAPAGQLQSHCLRMTELPGPGFAITTPAFGALLTGITTDNLPTQL